MGTDIAVVFAVINWLWDAVIAELVVVVVAVVSILSLSLSLSLSVLLTALNDLTMDK